MTLDKTPTDALAPGPFCGAPAHGYAIEPHSHSPAVLRLVPELPDHPGSYVIEGQCACGSGLIGANEAEVVARWNARWGSPVVAGEPYAYAVYFPDQPTEELVHDLDDLCDDLTNREHTITELYTTPQPTQEHAGAMRIAEGLLSPAIAALDRARIRDIFMAHGFTVKDGQTDLKQYVYDAADALLRAARAPADRVLEDAARQGWKAGLCCAVEQMKGAAPAQPAEGAAGTAS